jgi:hypothetical protein
MINGFIDLKIYIDLGLSPRSMYIYRSINPCIGHNGRLYLYNIHKNVSISFLFKVQQSRLP